MTFETNNKLLEGKVAQIVSEREIAINIGKKDGVVQGMQFSVLAATPQEVTDPDTGELLDTIDRSKIDVEATEVRDKITICSTFATKWVGGGLLAYNYQNLFGPSREVVETLRVEDSSLPAPLDPEESFVKIGDRVRAISEARSRGPRRTR